MSGTTVKPPRVPGSSVLMPGNVHVPVCFIGKEMLAIGKPGMKAERVKMVEEATEAFKAIVQPFIDDPEAFYKSVGLM